MENFKKFLKGFLNSLMCGVYVWFTMFLPVIGVALYVEYGLWWVAVIFVTIDFILIETYGRHYFRLNKHMYKDNTKLKIHHYVKDNDVWVESNDTIDSVIDVEIVRHETLKYEEYEQKN